MSDAEWRARYESRARRDLKRLDPQVRKRIVGAVDRFVREPEVSQDIRHLRGRAESRIRVGDWRVLLRVDRGQRLVQVQRILPRGRAYDR